MARVIIMPDAAHLTDGIRSTVYYAEEVLPENLASEFFLNQLMDRISQTIIEDAPAR